MSTIRLWIDSQEVEVKPAQTIMEAADSAGIYIPRLCFHPSLKPSGSCRLCAVEVEGHRGLPAACSTEVTEGMRIMTATSKVQEFRREMLRLILQDHPRECLGCARNGTCELQELVSVVGIDFAYPPPGEKRPPAKLAGSYFERDNSLCVHCGRCVRVCHEIRGAKVIVFREELGKQTVSTPFGRSLEETGCQFCGACVDVCPVGALRERLETYQGTPRAHMTEVCESLANIVISLYRHEISTDWKTSICPMCSAGCQMLFEVTDSQDIIQVRPDPAGPGNAGQACVQGRFLLKKYLKREDRLTVPQVRENGGYRAVDWNEALDVVSRKFQGYAPGEVACLTDGRLTNEELFALQKFAREGLRTELVASLAPTGHDEVARTFHKNFGVVANTLSLSDLKHAGCILAFGLNPAASYPLASPYIREATLSGTKLVVVSPCTLGLSRFADIHLPYHPGTEEILVAGFIAMMLHQKRVDHVFADNYPRVLEILKTTLSDFHPEHVGQATGIHHELLVDVGCLLAREPSLAILVGLGGLRSPRLKQLLQGLITLLHITGSFGKPGGGIAALYGNGNTQGSWDMGMAPGVLPGQKMQNGTGPGALSDLLDALRSGKVKGLFLAMESLEGSRMEELAPLIQNVEFVVLQDLAGPGAGQTAGMPPAHVVLPMASILEKGGTLTSGERRVQEVTPILDPPVEARSLTWVLSQLAGRMGTAGFQDHDFNAWFQLIQSEVSLYRGMQPGVDAVSWPCPEKGQGGTSNLFAVKTPPWVDWQPDVDLKMAEPFDADYPFALIPKEPVRAHFQGPLLAEETRRQFSPNDHLEMNPADAFSLGFRPDDTLRVSTRKGEWTARLVMNRLLPRNMVFVPEAAAQSHLGDPVSEGKIFAAKVEKG